MSADDQKTFDKVDKSSPQGPLQPAPATSSAASQKESVTTKQQHAKTKELLAQV